MLRIKQDIKTKWLQEHVIENKMGNLFPSFIIAEIFEFDDDSASSFDQSIWSAVNDGQMLIPVIVDSFGGQVYSLLRMLDTIAAAEKAGATIITIGKSKCMSCGSVLIAAGTKGFRYIQPNTTMMIHEVSSAGRGKNMEIQADAEETDRLNKLLLEKLSEFANKPKNFFAKLIHKAGHADMFIGAKDVVALGLADNVGEPNIELSLTLDVKINKK